jgi:hypothetical protein
VPEYSGFKCPLYWGNMGYGCLLWGIRCPVKGGQVPIIGGSGAHDRGVM